MHPMRRTFHLGHTRMQISFMLEEAQCLRVFF